MSRVSVIVPAFNADPYLAAALESALAQDPLPAEILVVDDASTDGTAALAETFPAPVRVIRAAHSGCGGARNRALEQATGDVFAFLDADDLWPAGRLARHLAVLADPAIDAVFGSVEQFVSPELTPEQAAEVVVDTRVQPAVLASTMTVRAEAFRRAGLFDETLEVGEMVDWYSRAVAAGLRFVTIADLALRRRIHATNLGRRRASARGDYLRALRGNLQRKREAGQP